MAYLLTLNGNGSACITQRKSLEDVTCPLASLDRVVLEVYCRTSGQDSACRNIPYALFNKRHDAIGNNALYKLGTHTEVT